MSERMRKPNATSPPGSGISRKCRSERQAPRAPSPGPHPARVRAPDLPKFAGLLRGHQLKRFSELYLLGANLIKIDEHMPGPAEYLADPIRRWVFQ